MVVFRTADYTTQTTILSNSERARTIGHDVCSRIRCLYMFANTRHSRGGGVPCQEHRFWPRNAHRSHEMCGEYAHHKNTISGRMHRVSGKTYGFPRTLFLLAEQNMVVAPRGSSNVYKRVFKIVVLKSIVKGLSTSLCPFSFSKIGVSPYGSCAERVVECVQTCFQNYCIKIHCI